VLPTLPFHVLRALFSSTPLTTDDGVLLRRMALEIGAIHLILACLSALSHHVARNPNGNASVSEVWHARTQARRHAGSPGLEKSLKKNSVPHVLEKSWKCVSHIFSYFTQFD